MIKYRLKQLIYRVKSIFKKKECPYHNNCPYNPLKEYPSCTMTTDKSGILIYKHK